MKYGEQLERESVPQWSLYNIDYNSLKHHIKAHTTKDQATAIAIPGQPDTTLSKFEDELYTELCRQHDRVDLFVKSKADELARRLQYLSDQIHKLILRSVTLRRGTLTLKRQRRFSRYESQLVICGDEIQALERFINAQVVAFRKILKKYKKWTGSSTLGTRFRDTILSHPKSFTKRDNTPLQTHYEDLLETLRATSSSDGSRIVSPGAQPTEVLTYSQPPVVDLSPSDTMVVTPYSPPTGYWNEYDHGSEAGDADQNGDGGYAIYVDPNADVSFPGMTTLKTLLKGPVDQWRVWTGSSQASETTDSERGALLPQHQHSSSYGSADASYFSTVPGEQWRQSDSDADDYCTDGAQPCGRRASNGYASSLEGFPTGYKPHYAALPSIGEQRLAQYRNRVLLWGTWSAYALSFALMGIAAILITSGRHKKRLEVDAGVTLGIMASLSCACAALCMASAHHGRSGWIYKLVMWATFATACVLNGLLLVMVMGNAPL